MMSYEQYTELRDLVIRQTVLSEEMAKDHKEIKEAMIPDGQSRMKKVEGKVETLHNWRTGILAVGGAGAGLFYVIINLEKFTQWLSNLI